LPIEEQSKNVNVGVPTREKHSDRVLGKGGTQLQMEVKRKIQEIPCRKGKQGARPSGEAEIWQVWLSPRNGQWACEQEHDTPWERIQRKRE
jgi:hypothetical protein